MTQLEKDDEPDARPTDHALEVTTEGNLLPMLISGIVLIVIGAICVMIFV